MYMKPQPSSASEPTRHPSVLIVGILLTFGILLVTVIFFARDHFKSYFASDTAVSTTETNILTELANATLLSKSSAYRFKENTVQAEEFAIGIPELFVNFGDTRLTVEEEAGSFVVKENGEEQFRSDARITAITHAPNTNFIAFSTQEGEDASSTVPIPAQFRVADVARSAIHLYAPDGGTTEHVVSGHAPLFINDYEFVFLSPSGVYLYDLSNGTARQLVNTPLSFVANPTLSSDGMWFSFYDIKQNSTLVYEINNDAAMLKTTIPELLLSPAFHQSTLYSLRSTAEGTEVMRFDFSNATSSHVYTIPAELSIHRLVF